MRRLFVGMLAILWAVIVSGCGSGKRSEMAVTPTVTGGRATCAVVWPDASRLVPYASNSVRVEFLLNEGVIAEGLLVRPTGGGRGTATFNNLPVERCWFVQRLIQQATGRVLRRQREAWL